MRIAIIENDKVVNIILSNTIPQNGVASDTANIGDDYINGEFITPQQTSMPKIKLEISLSGGDGRNDPIGLYNDGVNYIGVNVALKLPDDNILPITKQYRIIMRLCDGTKYEMLGVNIVDGQASFNYTTSGKTGEVHIEPEDMTETFDVGGVLHGIEVTGDCCFKVYRQIN